MKSPRPLEALIREVRGEKVILDSDLAELYGVPTKALNQAVKRNAERFPEDFVFRLTAEEMENLKSQIVTSSLDETKEETGSLRSQIATSSLENPAKEGVVPNRSQTVTGSQRHRDPRQRPYAFTEHGALQAANVLKSERAVAMGVYVIRAFVQMRAQFTANAAISQRLEQIDLKLLAHDEALIILWEKLKPLLIPPPPKPKSRIGF